MLRNLSHPVLFYVGLASLALAITVSACSDKLSPVPSPTGDERLGLRGPDLLAAAGQAQGNLIIGLRDGGEGSESLSTGELRRRIAALGGEITHSYRVFPAVAARVPLAAIPEIDSWDLMFVEPDFPIFLTATPDDPMYASQWGLNNSGQTGGNPGVDISAAEAWDVTTGSADVLIAIVDTGADTGHPDLAPNLWTNPGEIPGDGIDNDGNGIEDDVHGWDFLNRDATIFDSPQEDSHGTHVAGTAAAAGNNGLGISGVSWNSRLMILKFATSQGGGSASAALRAIDYATQQGADFINASWVTSTNSLSLRFFLERCNCTVVAAAGNGGEDLLGDDNDFSPQYPASYPSENILAVTAINATGNLASFANFGETTVDVAAPGVGILSTLPGGDYGLLSGTSMATPHVTGVAALALSQFPSLTPPELIAHITSRTEPIPSLQGRIASGGRVDAALAVAGGSANLPPLADAGPDQTVVDSDGDGGEPVTLDGSGSSDPDGAIVSHVWTEGESTLGTGEILAVTLALGTHTVTLTVTDDDGAVGTDEILITVDDAPPVPNQAPVADAGADQTVTDTDGDGLEAVILDGSASFDPDGSVVAFAWAEDGTDLGDTEQISVDLAVGVHTVVLTVTDDAGATASDSVEVDIRSGTLVEPPNSLSVRYSRGEMRLRWNRSGTLDVTYSVYRSQQSGGPYDRIASGEAGRRYVDRDLVTGTTYFYVVTAVDANGEESAASNEDSAMAGGK